MTSRADMAKLPRGWHLKGKRSKASKAHPWDPHKVGRIIVAARRPQTTDVRTTYQELHYFEGTGGQALTLAQLFANRQREGI